jgi:hypothetical protein
VIGIIIVIESKHAEDATTQLEPTLFTQFPIWSEGRLPSETRIRVGAFVITLAELLDVDSREFARDLAIPVEVLDAFEAIGRPWSQFGDWLWRKVSESQDTNKLKTIEFRFGPGKETGTLTILGPHVLIQTESGEESWCLTYTYTQSGDSEACLVGWSVDSPLTHSYLENLPLRTYWQQFLLMMPDDIRLAVSRLQPSIPGFCED